MALGPAHLLIFLLLASACLAARNENLDEILRTLNANRKFGPEITLGDIVELIDEAQNNIAEVSEQPKSMQAIIPKSCNASYCSLKRPDRDPNYNHPLNRVYKDPAWRTGFVITRLPLHPNGEQWIDLACDCEKYGMAQ